MPERPSLEEAKDAIMAMRAVVIIKVSTRLQIHGRSAERFSIYVDGVLEEALADSARVNARHYPICVDDPHLLILSDRMPLKRV